MVVIPSVPGRKYYEERNKKDVASSGDWNQSVDSMNKKLDSINEGSNSINNGLDSMNKGLDSMNKGLDSVNEKLDSLNEDLDTLKENTNSIHENFVEMLNALDGISNYAPKNETDFKESEESKEEPKTR